MIKKIALTGLLAASSAAFAGEEVRTLNVSGTVLGSAAASCTVTTPNGTDVVLTSDGANVIPGQPAINNDFFVRVSCDQENAPFRVRTGFGTYSLSNGSNQVLFSAFRDAGHGLIWAGGRNYTADTPDGAEFRTDVPVYFKALRTETLRMREGTYNGTVDITVTF